ncbi:MAG: hypothetical protein ACYDGO_05810 [Smithellaceae bacterium]
MRRSIAGCYDGFCPTRNDSAGSRETVDELNNPLGRVEQIKLLSLRVPMSGRGNLFFHVRLEQPCWLLRNILVQSKDRPVAQIPFSLT